MPGTTVNSESSLVCTEYLIELYRLFPVNKIFKVEKVQKIIGSAMMWKYW